MRRESAGSSSKASRLNSGDPVKAQTVRLPASLWRKLKIRAVDEERPMSEIIRDALHGYLGPKQADEQ
jgi:hypothetical protein